MRGFAVYRGYLHRTRPSVASAFIRLNSTGVLNIENFARIDLQREARVGFPEVIFAEGKTNSHFAKIMYNTFKKTGGVVIGTRVSKEQVSALENMVRDSNEPALVTHNEDARICHINQQVDKREEKNKVKGQVAVLCAGTSDYGIAEEAAVMLELSNVEKVTRLYDVGVAGLNRLLTNIEVIKAADVIIVCAGMDGALPSVVGGLAKAPVIAVPTSVGYGAAFGGVSALLTMLNACAPGVTVVNIDNGFGAAVTAYKMLKVSPDHHKA
jgi:NCAIR mutase (PurE)-related protein